MMPQFDMGDFVSMAFIIQIVGIIMVCLGTVTMKRFTRNDKYIIISLSIIAFVTGIIGINLIITMIIIALDLIFVVLRFLKPKKVAAQ